MKVKVAKHDSVNGCLLVEAEVAASFCKEFTEYVEKYGRELEGNEFVPVVGAEFLHALSNVDWTRLYCLLISDETNFVALAKGKENSNE